MLHRHERIILTILANVSLRHHAERCARLIRTTTMPLLAPKVGSMIAFIGVAADQQKALYAICRAAFAHAGMLIAREQ